MAALPACLFGSQPNTYVGIVPEEEFNLKCLNSTIKKATSEDHDLGLHGS